MSLTKCIYAVAGTAFFSIPAIVPTGVSAQDAKTASDHSTGAALSIPSSIEVEHKELHEHLAKVLNSGGRTEIAAREVEKLLDPHFRKEEQYAMPPLGMLSSLAAGKVPAGADTAIKMTDRLKAEMPEMLREHKEITAALQRLRTAAKDEGKQDAVQFAEALIAHATQEEQILYPSAIMVGEYLKLKR